MDEGTKVSGYVNVASGLNRRSSPGGDKILSPLPNKTAITGEIKKDDAGGDWVRLESINGEPVTIFQYVAAWYCHLDVVSTPPVPPTVPPEIKEISALATITGGKLIVTVDEPNGGLPVTVIVNKTMLVDGVTLP